MKPLFLLAPALAFAIASVASAVGTARPNVRARLVADLATAADEAVMKDLEITVGNYRALERFYRSAVRPQGGDYEGALWATQAVQPEAAALESLCVAAEKIMQKGQRTRPVPPRTAAAFSEEPFLAPSPDDDRVWILAQRRAKFADALVALYWTRVSSRANDSDYQLALDAVKDARERLAPLVVAAKPQ